MIITYAQTQKSENVDHNIFLAGPSPRDEKTKSWRSEAINILDLLCFEGNVFVPEMKNGWHESFGYEAQIEWEESALNESDVIVFWVPRELKKMPALTTNIEWGHWTSKDPKRLVLGYPEGTPKMNYLTYYANKLNIPLSNTLYETLKTAMKKLEKDK